MRAPESGTVERWAWDYVLSAAWDDKLDPPAVPERWEAQPPPRRLAGPGRGPGFSVSDRGARSTGKSELRSAERRLKLIHGFLHHELQAAELMAFAVLAFPEAPSEVRRGWLRVLGDEVRHMRSYRDLLQSRGVRPGDLPVRDWFWERVPACPDAASFLATMGVGFEGGNLDHAARFAARFRAAGDDEAAALQERIGREEIAHVRFAVRWFGVLSGGGLDGRAGFEAFRRALPPPLSPMLMRGQPLARAARTAAGLDADFLDELERASEAPLDRPRAP